jgi:putative Ca2+/H+ antiporter (TMEM165/GDT1 family)
MGSACGTLAADIPAVLLANRFSTALRLGPIRLAAGAMLMIVGAIVVVSTLGLI